MGLNSAVQWLTYIWTSHRKEINYKNSSPGKAENEKTVQM